MEGGKCQPGREESEMKLDRRRECISGGLEEKKEEKTKDKASGVGAKTGGWREVRWRDERGRDRG